MGNNLIYGFHSINSIIWQTPDAIEIIYLEKKRPVKRSQELITITEEKGISVELVSSKFLDKLCGSLHHQGVAASLKPNLANQFSLKDFLLKNTELEYSIIVVLDGITDPHNLGAIIRSCECFGVSAVIIPKDNSAGINATVAKVSSGAINQIPVIVVNNLARSLDEIKNSGYWIAGTTLTTDSVNLFEFKPDKRIVWVMGSEDSGIRRLVQESCDYLVSIPMYGNTQSLNVSVAAGVVLSYTKYIHHNTLCL